MRPTCRANAGVGKAIEAVGGFTGLPTTERFGNIMDERMQRRGLRLIFGFLTLNLVWLAGCMQFAANLLHIVGGPQVPADFKGLENKRVALVVSSETGTCRDEATIRLAGNFKGILATKLPKTKFVSQEEIDQWIEGSSASEQDLSAIGHGVQADYLIAVEMMNLQLKDGPTLYRGRSDLSLRVWDVKTEKAVFIKQYPSHSYPSMAGPSTTEMDESQFRRVYLLHVAEKLSRHFYAHDFGEEVASDATFLKY